MKFKKSLSLIIFLTVIGNSSLAADTTFDYPELSVVPRASERLEIEAAKEKGQSWQNHLPFLVPATMTALSGAALMVNGTRSDLNPRDTSSKVAPYVGLGVGAAWWIVSVGILDRMDIYEDGAKEAAKVNGRTQREQLLRERRAEEALFKAGSIARKLKWLSFASNLGASIYMIDAAKDGQFAKYVAVASAVTALTPFIFSHAWQTNESIHRDYKKRIYAPVVGATMLQDPNQRSFSPGLLLALHF